MMERSGMIKIVLILKSCLLILIWSIAWVSNGIAAESQSFNWVEQIKANKSENGEIFIIKGTMPASMASTVSVQSRDSTVEIKGWMVKPETDTGADFEFAVTSPRFYRGGYFALDLIVDHAGEKRSLLSQSGERLSLHVTKTKHRHWIALAAILFTIGLGFSRRFQAGCYWLGCRVENNQKKLALSITAVALLLITAGWTGSSWRLWANTPAGQSFLELQGSQWQVHSPKFDRWDEWGVITPAIFAQLNHEPKFPIINTNIGPEGQNMGVMGMFGVPVAQVAALARPATWGYFVLPLRQAMSWQWQIQFWGCLLTIWWLLNTLCTGQAGRNLALATAFCMVPYAAGWSNWPLYASLFPALGVCLLAKLLRTQSVMPAVWTGAALGWVLAAWVLVLYPPWLVIVGSLCALLMLGWMADHRKELTWGLGQWFAMTAAVVVSGVLLGSWWMDTQDAIAQVQATVYPGGRQAEVGGSAPLIWSLRGYLGLEAFAHYIGPASNKPELSSYFYVPLAMAAVLIWGVLRMTRFRGIWFSLATFVAAYACYSFVGFPVWLAQISKWGMLTTNRMDLGMGMAMIILVCLLPPYSQAARSQSITSSPLIDASRFANVGIGVALSVTSAALAWWVLMHTSADLMPINPLPYRIGIALLCAAMAWWLWNRQAIGVTLALLVTGFGAAFSYTPISKAPKAVELSGAIRPFVTAEGKPQRLTKTLVVDGDSLPAVTLAAVGVPVIDGVLYYPHRSMWQSIQLPDDQWPVVNRYQHLTFMPANNVDSFLHYRAISPRMDAVTVFFDPVKFDFARTSAERVVSHESVASLLDKNPQLERMGKHLQYVWFRVK